MLPLLPRCWQLAMGMPTRLLKHGGIAGPESWGSPCQQQQQQFTFFSTSPGHQSQGQGESQTEDHKALKEWALTVSPFGLLKVRLPCHLALGPLDPHKHPTADRVFVAMKGPNAGPHHNQGPGGLQVEYNEALKEVTIASDRLGSAASVAVRVPFKFDLDIKISGNGSVKIEKIECDSCRIETERGTSILQSIKSQKLDIHAKGGKVICLGTIQGNADINVTEGSSVNIEKLQGSSINISTKNGLIKTKYLYAESSFLSSAAGDILLGNIHDSADGSLKASTYQGEIDVYVVSQVGDVDLKSQNGDVTVKVPVTLNADLQLSGSKVEVSPEIHCQDIQKVSREGCIIVTGCINQKEEKGKHIKAETQNGTVNLRSQTWFQSVKLKAA
ncbi:protein FAM185A isoform X2 [Sceloporus undulatus]|uniref:protein FAM185A isoform X2 n=1 Tax=Sceloporus undulatus TaxID=8520 RepID=UPI001C4C3F8E|nr:protein FAM185A isoform X2 [Sceloporus undulatus]